MHLMSRVSRYPLIGGAVLAASVGASAQAQDLQQYRPSANGQGLFGLESADTLESWRPTFGLSFNHAQVPFTVQPSNGDLEILAAYQLVTHVQAAIGLFSRADLGIDLPIALAQDGTSIYTTDGALAARGLGDLRVTPRVRLVGAPGGPIAVSIVLPFTVHTGLEEHYLGEGGLTFNPQIAAGGHPGRLSWGVTAGYRLRPAVNVLYTPVNSYLTLGNEITYGAALDLRVLDPLRAGLEIQGAVGSQAGLGDSPLEARLGARLDLKNGLSAVLGGGLGLIGGYGSPTWRAFAGISYSLGRKQETTETGSSPDPNADSDGDGILDPVDRCPAIPELLNGLEDADGCPEPDKDFDQVADALDKCPVEAEDRDGFQDEDGCPDPDNDGDKLLDGVDQCPNESEDFDGFHDEDGCPEPDNDGDGVLDANDQCPKQQETRNGYQDEDGCPEADGDQDGVPDAIDKCKKKPETHNGYKDEDGCPEPDRDGDGVADAVDKCPRKKETLNGFQDEDGCPDEAPPASSAATPAGPDSADADGDGLPDRWDDCPEKPETINGYKDNDGCPEPDTDGDGIVDALDKCPNARENTNGVRDSDGCPD